MCVWLNTCMCVWFNTFVCVCVWLNTCMCVYDWIHFCVCMIEYICVCDGFRVTCMCVFKFFFGLWMCVFVVWLNTFIWECACIHVYDWIHFCVCMIEYMYVCMIEYICVCDGWIHVCVYLRSSLGCECVCLLYDEYIYLGMCVYTCVWLNTCICVF